MRGLLTYCDVNWRKLCKKVLLVKDVAYCCCCLGETVVVAEEIGVFEDESGY